MSEHIFVMSMVLSMAPLHSLDHNDQNNVKNVMPLVPALLSCDANCIINGTIRCRQLKQGVTWPLG